MLRYIGVENNEKFIGIMANKREFKKSVEALSSALVEEMLANLDQAKEADAKKINEAISRIAGAMLAARKETNVLFGKGVKEFANLKEYNEAKAKFTKDKYDRAIAGYNQALEEALKLYNEAMPKNEKAS